MVNMIQKSEECILVPKLSCHFCGIYMYPPRMFLCFTKRTKKGEILTNIVFYFCAPLSGSMHTHAHLCIYVNVIICMYVRSVNTRKVRIPKMKIHTNKRWCDDRTESRGLQKCIIILTKTKRRIETLFH